MNLIGIVMPERRLIDLLNVSVIQFAADHSLEYHLFYHDMPVWKLDAEGSDGCVRDLQIGVYAREGVLELTFIPEKFRVTSGENLLCPQEEIAKYILRIPMQTLEEHGEDSVTRKAQIRVALATAWRST